MRILCFLLGLLLTSNAANAQDVFDMFGYGAEYKASAGAGTVTSRGPAANYYNPANLIRSGKSDPYYELDIVRLEYTYTFPLYLPIELRKTSPVPFLGWASRANRRFAYGFSLIPLPESSSEMKIDGLPTLMLSSDAEAGSKPIVVDINQKGAGGFGFRFSGGIAMQLFGGFSAGLSLLAEKAGSETEIIDDESQNTAAILSSESSSTQVILGTRGSVMNGKMIATTRVKLPKSKSTKSSTSMPLFGDVSKDTSNDSKGPLGFGIGFKFNLGRFSPYIEATVDKWSDLKAQEGYVGIEPATYDYFDAMALIVGGSYRWGTQSIMGGYGQFQTHLGEGIMASESASDTELIGMQFQDIHAIPYSRLALGYKKVFKSGHLRTGFSWLSGEREVWDRARGYGSYEIDIYQFIFGGIYRI